MVDWQKQRRAALKEKLLPAQDEARLLQTYGEAIRPVLDKVLDEKVEGLARAQEASWQKFGEYLTAETRHQTDKQLLSHEEAAKMLGCSVATVKRMVYDGRLPEPVRISERRIGHRYTDIKQLIGSSRG